MTKTYEIPHELLLQAPDGVLVAIAQQMTRWFGREVNGHTLLNADLNVRTNDETPPEWILLFEALSVAHWDTVRTAITVLNTVTATAIKRRTVKAKVSV